MMHIGFDVSDLSARQADGTTRYTRELAQRLPQLAPQLSWDFFSPTDYKLAPSLPNVKKHIVPWPKYWTQLRLPFALQRTPLDLLFMPIQQLPLVRPRVKTVAVIHDVAFHHYPQQFTYKDWLLLHAFTAHVAREADKIIAVSQATARDIARYYGRTKNISVIHHGVDHAQFKLPNEAERAQGWLALKEAIPQLEKSYLLFVGQIQPRKNIVHLIEAYEQLQGNYKGQLVIAGGHGWLQKEIHQKISASPVRSRIILTGRIPDTLLPALYWHTDAFVLPSLYEGFGLPLLEAFASGCPVVTSNVSSLPEVAGDAAILVNPLDSSEIAAGIKEALAHRPELMALGLKRATQFSWDETARQTLEVLRD